MGVGVALVLCFGLLGSWYVVKKKKLHSKLLFRIGYLIYARTRVGYIYHKRVVNTTIAKGSHSKPKTIKMGDIAIHVIPILGDNYAYLVEDTLNGVGVVIDPADPYTLQKVLVEKKINLHAVLTTHKHWDHAGGNLILKEMHPDLLVYGSHEDKPLAVNRYVRDKDCIKVGQLEFTARFTPGHTVGHMVYLLTSTEQYCLFSGDHLFCGGCGKVFEGSHEEMLQSLKLVKSMSQSTLIFPGHEYTFRNMQFALSIEPDNEHLERKMNEIKALRIKRESTVPSVLMDELKISPFLRTDSLKLQNFTNANNEVTTLQTLRELKNAF